MENSLSRAKAPSPRKQSGELGGGVLSRPSSVSPFSSGVQVQAKLETTEVNDPLEREADTMADLVMRKIDTGSSGVLPPPSSNPRPSVSAFGGTSVTLPSTMESRLNASLGGGHALPGALRSQMEGAFGQPFSQVRIHTDSSSAEMNQGIGARAFTYGNDIFFNQGQYNPSSADGQRLIAHELTHVAQQSGKVARESHTETSRGFVRQYFISSWHWGIFYTYLLSHHPSVVKALGIELDEGLTGKKWNKERGTSFLEKVSDLIVTEINKRNKLGDNWNPAYRMAIEEFDTMNEVYGHELGPAFKALITITENRRKKLEAYESAKWISYKAQQEAADNAPQEKVSFDGSFFDNSIQPIFKMYRFLKEVYPEGLARRVDFAFFNKIQTIKNPSDISRNSDEFADLIEQHLNYLINQRFDAYCAQNNLSNSNQNLDRFLGLFANEVLKHATKYDAAWVLYNIVVDRQKKIYSQEFHVPDFLVSAETWTALFCEIMIEAASFAIGGPIFGQVVSNVVMRNPLARKMILEAADIAMDFTLNASAEAMRRKIRGQEMNVAEVLKAAGMSTLLNWGIGKGLDAALGRNGGNNALAGVLTGGIQRPDGAEQSDAYGNMESITFDESEVIPVVSGDIDVIEMDEPEVIQVEDPWGPEVIKFDDPEVISVDDPHKRKDKKPRKKKPRTKKPRTKPELPDLDPGSEPDETEPGKKDEPKGKEPDVKKPGEPGQDKPTDTGPDVKKPGEPQEDEPKDKRPDENAPGEPKADEPTDTKPTEKDSEDKDSDEQDPDKKDPKGIWIPDITDLIPDFDFDIDWEPDIFEFLSECAKRGWKEVLEFIFNADWEIVKYAFKKWFNITLGKGAEITFKILKSLVATYPTLKYYLFEDEGSTEKRNEAFISTGGGLLSVWLPWYLSPIVTLATDTGNKINHYALSDDQVDIARDLGDLAKSQFMQGIPYSNTHQMLGDGVNWLMEQENEVVTMESTGNRQQDVVREPSSEPSPANDLTPAPDGLDFSARDRWLDALRDLNDNVIKQAQSISKGKTGDESSDVSLNDLLFSIGIVTSLSLGEGGREGSMSPSHSFNELYALAMKMKAKSEQRGISPSLRKKYLLVAAYIYGLASYVASDGSKSAVRKRAERWKTRADNIK